LNGTTLQEETKPATWLAGEKLLATLARRGPQPSSEATPLTQRELEAAVADDTAPPRKHKVAAVEPPLRASHHRAGNRAEAVRLATAAAARDPEFQRLIMLADTARDQRDWPEAEYRYWQALSLYPLHAGYLVQYGHALKEQQKLPDAEVAYRSALALGEAVDDLQRHIAHVGAMLSFQEPAERPLPMRLPAGHPLADPPTRDDVELIFALLLHRAPHIADEMLALLRSAPTRHAVLLAVLAKEEVATANSDLMLLLAEAG
jgi:tetratricopeptide (TPR) repeat protein